MQPPFGMRYCKTALPQFIDRRRAGLLSGRSCRARLSGRRRANFRLNKKRYLSLNGYSFSKTKFTYRRYSRHQITPYFLRKSSYHETLLYFFAFFPFFFRKPYWVFICFFFCTFSFFLLFSLLFSFFCAANFSCSRSFFCCFLRAFLALLAK